MNKELYELSYSLKKDLEKKVLTVIFVLAAVFVVLNFILFFIIYPVKVNTVSMNPDLSKESVVLFTPLKKSVNRGDVVLLKSRNTEQKKVMFRIVNSFLNFFTARQIDLSEIGNFMGDRSQIRRVIGVPGDTIYMRDYVMYIKPAGENLFLTEFELIDKSYDVNINAAPAMWDSSIGVAGSFDEIQLKDGQYFVLGDLRNSAVDSRLWGPVDAKSVKASAVCCYFPFNKLAVF